MTSRSGIQIPLSPPIQPVPHEPPFIMFVFCANETPVVNKDTVPIAIASKFFVN